MLFVTGYPHLCVVLAVLNLTFKLQAFGAEFGREQHPILDGKAAVAVCLPRAQSGNFLNFTDVVLLPVLKASDLHCLQQPCQVDQD